MAEGKVTPPFGPIAGWGSRTGSHYMWSWNPQWEAAAGRALAHLLVASEGRPVTVPSGMVEEMFQRALDVLLPANPPPRRAALAGPGRPAPDAEILLVPVHPQTGETWAPADRPPSAHSVPLPFGVWLWLAFPEPDLPVVPASGTLPEGVLRDDPPVPRAHHLFRPDSGLFRHTLVRLPAVRSPWLREILENLPQHMRARIF